MKNYEAEKLKKIIAHKELAMIEQVKETDRLRNELKSMYTFQDMNDAFYAGKNYYYFEPWIEEFKNKLK